MSGSDKNGIKGDEVPVKKVINDILNGIKKLFLQNFK